MGLIGPTNRATINRVAAKPPRPNEEGPFYSANGGGNPYARPQSTPQGNGGSVVGDQYIYPEEYPFGLSNKFQLGFTANSGELRQAGIPFGVPNYSPLLNDKGNDWKDKTIASKYSLSNQYDNTALNNLSKYANSTKPSKWLTGMNTEIGRQAQQGYDEQAYARQSGLKNAYNNMAMRGGLQSGGTAGIERASLRDLMLGRQRGGMAQNEALNKANLSEQEQKQQVLAQLPGLNLQKAQYNTDLQKANINALQGERLRQYGAGQDLFKTLMAGWGGTQQSNSMLASQNNNFLGI